MAVSVRPGRHRVLEVESERGVRIGRVRQRVVALHRLRVDLADGIRHQLELLRRAAHLEAGQLAELRDESVGVARQHRPGRRFREPADFSNHGEAHRTTRRVVEPQLRERDAELRAPAVRVFLDWTSHTASQLSSLLPSLK